MTSGEHSNPPFHDELFAGFAGMIVARGTVNYDPLDPSLGPGNDGALTPEGEPAAKYSYEVPDDTLPPPVRDLGVGKVSMTYCVALRFDGGIYPETVSVEARFDDMRITKTLKLSKEDGVVESLVYSEASEDYEDSPRPAQEIGETLSDEEKNEIIFEIGSGNFDFLHADGPAGEYARSVYMKLGVSMGPAGVDDVELLRGILAGLDPEGEFQTPS